MLTAFVGRFTSRTGEIGIDPRVLLFTLASRSITGLLFGTLPALASRADLVERDEAGQQGRRREPRTPARCRAR